MRTYGNGLTSLMLAAVAAMASMAQVAKLQATLKPAKTQAGSRTRQTGDGVSRGPGWSVAQVKRMALKKRNQQRNRRAHRRAGAQRGY